MSAYLPFSPEKRKYNTQQPRQSTYDRAIRRRAFALLKQYVESLGSEDVLISDVPDSVVVNNTRLVLKSESLSFVSKSLEDFNVSACACGHISGNDDKGILKCRFATRRRKVDFQSSGVSQANCSNDASELDCSKDIVACTLRGQRFVCSKHAKPDDVKYLGQAVKLKSEGGKKMSSQVRTLYAGDCRDMQFIVMSCTCREK